MTKYYKMPSGKFPTQGGTPVLITQAQFEECCCEGEPEPADYKLIPCYEVNTECTWPRCPAGTPLFLTVTFSNVSICTECQGASETSWKASGVLNDSYVLEWAGQWDNECWWIAPEKPGPIVTRYGDETDCTGDSTSSETVDIAVRRKDADVSEVWASSNDPEAALFEGSYTDACDEVGHATNIYDECTINAFGIGGTATIVPGDVEDQNSRCPGGDPIYTDTDLSSCVGKVVELDDGVCYTVEANEDEDVSQGDVTVVDAFANCSDACDDVDSIGFPCP